MPCLLRNICSFPHTNLIRKPYYHQQPQELNVANGVEDIKLISSSSRRRRRKKNRISSAGFSLLFRGEMSQGMRRPRLSAARNKRQRNEILFIRGWTAGFGVIRRHSTDRERNSS
ncbi:hypothetical protein CEXT_556401 [Caerostris extrusa]|uniref:Uncharacterized protein n=1 Tax=Caerostris extrusa TaxID=172846 RepID=A0AAV4X2V8_CAEEX|nr:hypothetical protein CEXT_556401 [Caerostris extrusa]